MTLIRHSTITNNRAGNAGGGVASRGNQLLVAPTWTEIYSSIIAGNMGNDVDFGVANTTNSFSSLGYNIVGTGNAVAAFNQPGDQFVVTNPMLGPLAANGGPTTTHAILPGNPAIDAGDPTFDPADPDGNPMTDDALPYDQRGAVHEGVRRQRRWRAADRHRGGRAQPIPPAVFGDYNQNGTVDAAD